MDVIGQTVADWFRGQPYVSGIALSLFLTGPLFFATAVPTWIALSVLAVLMISLTLLTCQLYRLFSTPESPSTPIERLRHRYATGELSDAEFELRLERLLESSMPQESSITQPAPAQSTHQPVAEQPELEQLVE